MKINPENTKEHAAYILFEQECSFNKISWVYWVNYMDDEIENIHFLKKENANTSEILSDGINVVSIGCIWFSAYVRLLRFIESGK